MMVSEIKSIYKKNQIKIHKRVHMCVFNSKTIVNSEKNKKIMALSVWKNKIVLLLPPT